MRSEFLPKIGSLLASLFRRRNEPEIIFDGSDAPFTSTQIARMTGQPQDREIADFPSLVRRRQGWGD